MYDIIGNKVDNVSAYMSYISIKLLHTTGCREMNIGNSKKLIDNQKSKYKTDQSFILLSVTYKKTKASPILSIL